MLQQVDSQPHVTPPTAPVKDAADWRGFAVKDCSNWTLLFDGSDIAKPVAALLLVVRKVAPLASVTKSDFSWVQPAFTKSSPRFEEVPRYTDAQWEAFELAESPRDCPRLRLDMAFGKGDMQFLYNHAPATPELPDWHTAPTPGRRVEVYIKDALSGIEFHPC
jgi:hypothetical protein